MIVASNPKPDDNAKERKKDKKKKGASHYWEMTKSVLNQVLALTLMSLFQLESSLSFQVNVYGRGIQKFPEKKLAVSLANSALRKMEKLMILLKK